MEKKLTNLKKVINYIYISWFFLISLSVSWNIYHENEQMKVLALNTALSIIEKDKSFRDWATTHGGVYVPITKRTPPNPYLIHIENRDLYLKDKNLTLMNPAYMIRQFSNEYGGLYGAKTHITSLNPLNPKYNTPDEWEVKVLKMFEDGKREFYEFIDIKGEKYLKAMKAMITKEGCLKCHAHQGYKVGDTRGGVSVTVPLLEYQKSAKSIYASIFLTHLFIFLIGFYMIYLSYKKIKIEVDKNLANQKILMQQSKMAEMGEMIGAITHQLKQPLNSISVLSQTVSLRHKSLSEEKIVEKMNKIKFQSEFMSETIDDFKNFFKPTKSKKEFFIQTSINKSLNILSTQFKNHNILVNISGEDIAIRGYENEFLQVILNLLNNSKDAFIENSINNGKIDINIKKENSHVIIDISDNAGGIKDELIDKIFNYYFSTKGESGTGVGLYIVRMIIQESFLGTIKAKNIEGGVKFNITIPLLTKI